MKKISLKPRLHVGHMICQRCERETSKLKKSEMALLCWSCFLKWEKVKDQCWVRFFTTSKRQKVNA
jgi:hypothetical protein